MNTWKSFFYKVFLLQSITTNKFTNFSQLLILHPIRTKPFYQFLYPAHALSPSSSITIRSISLRSTLLSDTISRRR